MLTKYVSVVFVWVIVSGEDSSTFLVRRNESQQLETSTYKYPTATWSAKNYEMKKKKYDPDMMIKLFLFKPSPFLKPPFTDGSVGSITTIDDGVNVSGRRRGKIKADKYEQVVKKPFIQKLEPKNSRHIDEFLAQALMNYVKSSNLTDEFGMITVEEFSDALRKVTENRKMMIYEENKDMRKKFRDDVLNPKRMETTTPSGILEKQYQRRLQKTWEVINENISIPSRSATLDRRIDWEMGKPRETQMQTAQEDPTTPQYLYSRITQSTPVMTTKLHDDWPTETESYENNTPLTQETEKPSEKFRVSETGWRDVIAATTTTTESVLVQPDWHHENFDTNEISLTTPVDESSPTTFRPMHFSGDKKKIKTFRGKKKWRDTVPAAQEIKTWDDGEVKLSVAETVYYRPRQTQLESFKYQSTVGSIPGEPETDYPMLGKVPSTGFKCPKTDGENTIMIADRKARCQVGKSCPRFA